MLENPEAIVFSARVGINESISKLRHARTYAAKFSLEDESVIMQAEHDLWEIYKTLKAFEDERL